MLNELSYTSEQQSLFCSRLNESPSTLDKIKIYDT